MNNYGVTITETLQRTVVMKAMSQEQANSLVREKYHNGELVLDSSDHTGTTIREDEVAVREAMLANIVDAIIKEGTAQTSTGNWIFPFELFSKEDINSIRDNRLVIEAALSEREEVLDVEISDKGFDVIFALDFCPNLEKFEFLEPQAPEKRSIKERLSDANMQAEGRNEKQHSQAKEDKVIDEIL